MFALIFHLILLDTIFVIFNISCDTVTFIFFFSSRVFERILEQFVHKG